MRERFGMGAMSRLAAVWMVAGLTAGLMAGGIAGVAQQGAGAPNAKGETVLSAADATKLLPAQVYFKGQSATTQLRNSGGVKFADGFYVLASMVDTSGYSSDVQQKYQAYLIAEVPIKIEGHELAAGVYGVGFVDGNKFVVLDVGAHDLFSVGSHRDEALKRALPLKVTADGAVFRLYAGRNYVSFAR
jgi:hypothetical protein